MWSLPWVPSVSEISGEEAQRVDTQGEENRRGEEWAPRSKAKGSGQRVVPHWASVYPLLTSTLGIWVILTVLPVSHPLSIWTNKVDSGSLDMLLLLLPK